MDQSAEFNQCFEELDKLRSIYLKTEQTLDDSVLKSVNDFFQKQLSFFPAIHDFFWKLITNSSLKERLESDDNSITMPGRDSVLNLIESTKASLEIHKEVALGKKCESVTDAEFVETQKANLGGFSYGDLNNHEFNRYFRNAVQYYNVQPETEELGDSTVNTIVSEDVLASSPF